MAGARGPRRWLALAVAALASASSAMLISPAPAVAQTGFAGAEVVELEFVGPTVFDEAALRTAIVTQPTQCRLLLPLVPICWLGFGLDRRYLDDRLFEDNYRLVIFYHERGYRQARVRSRVEPLSVPAAEENGNNGFDPDRVPAVRVVFHIEHETPDGTLAPGPGEPVRIAQLEIKGLDQVGVDLTRGLPLQVGSRLDQLLYEASRDTLLSRLRNRGYAYAEVLGASTIPADAPLSAHFEIEVITGPTARYGPIEVVGAEHVSPTVVRRMLTFEPGDLYRHDDILRSQRNLFGLEVFRHAAIEVDLDNPEDTIVPVRVQVSEGDLHRVRIGTGVSTAECVNGEVRWTSRNFMGGARRLELRGRFHNVLAGTLNSFPCFDTGNGEYSKLGGSIAADFTQPWLFSPSNSFGGGVFAERRSVPDVFVRTALGGYVSLTRTISRASVTLGYRPELTKLNAEGDLIFCVSFVVCELSDIQVLRSPHWLAPITLSAGRDRANSIFAPTAGDVIRLDAEYASGATGSEFAYTRVLGDASIYRQVVPGLVVATRVRAGVGRSITTPELGEGLGLHPQKRFFGGGPNSVRGFAQYQLGPKILTVDAARVLAAPVEDGGAGCTIEEINSGTCSAAGVALDLFDPPRPVGGAAVFEGNFELRFPLWNGRLGGAAFMDFGQVWRGSDEMDLSQLAWTPGLGVRYFSPIGPIRVDLGYNSAGGEALDVITNELDEDGRNTGRLRALQEKVFWNPRTSFLDRLQLHISIGQAF